VYYAVVSNGRGWCIIHALALATISLYTKFEVSITIRYVRRYKMSKMGWFGSS